MNNNLIQIIAPTQTQIVMFFALGALAWASWWKVKEKLPVKVAFVYDMIASAWVMLGTVILFRSLPIYAEATTLICLGIYLWHECDSKTKAPPQPNDNTYRWMLGLPMWSKILAVFNVFCLEALLKRFMSLLGIFLRFRIGAVMLLLWMILIVWVFRALELKIENALVTKTEISYND